MTEIRILTKVGRLASDRNAPAHRPSDPDQYRGEVLVVPVPADEAWVPGDLLQWAVRLDHPAPDGWPGLPPSWFYEPKRYRVLSVNSVVEPRAVIKAIPIDAGRDLHLDT